MKEEREKMEKLLETIEQHPLTQKVREDKAAETLAKRQEAAGKIAALQNEEGFAIPKMQAVRGEKERIYLSAKAALQAASDEFQTAHAALLIERSQFANEISRQEQVLIETVDPALDAAITFFREKLDWFRTPGRISINRRGAESNIFTEKIKTKVESNRPAILSALQYCQEAVAELERMKLTPALDLQKIEGMKKGIPDIGIFSEFTAERPMPGVPPMIRPRFGGAGSDEYEQTLLDRIHKKANDFLSKPPIPRPGRK